MLGGFFGALKDLINTALNFIAGIVDAILNIINAVLNFIKKLINMILDFIRQALNLLMGKLCMMLGISHYNGVSIVNKTMNYMQKAMGPFGALISGKAKLIKNYTIPDLGTLFITDILNTSLIAGVLSARKWSKGEYDNILRNLIDACGLTSVIRGLRQMFSSGTHFEYYYYEKFYSIAEEHFSKLENGGTKYEIFQLLNNKHFIQLDYLKKYRIYSYGTLFTLYKRLGWDKSHLGYLVEISSMSSLDSLIPKPYQSLDYSITDAEIEALVGDDYTLFEEAALVRNGSSIVVRKPAKYADNADDIIKYQRDCDSFAKCVKNKYPMAADKELSVTESYTLNNPMNFSLSNYTSSITPKTTTTSNTEMIQSTCGIPSIKLDENTRQVEFEGFKNNVDIEVNDGDNLKPSKYNNKLVFKM